MAQTVDDIAEILNEMRLKNDLSTENLEKLLSDMNLKLAVIADDEVGELVKVYISELKSFVEAKTIFAFIPVFTASSATTGRVAPSGPLNTSLRNFLLVPFPVPAEAEAATSPKPFLPPSAFSDFSEFFHYFLEVSISNFLLLVLG